MENDDKGGLVLTQQERKLLSLLRQTPFGKLIIQLEGGKVIHIVREQSIKL